MGNSLFMFVDREASVGEPALQERRKAEQGDKRILGNVVQCDGARATISAFADDDDGTVTGIWTVGTAMGLINDIPTVGELVSRIVDEAEEIISGRLGDMLEVPAEENVA